VATVSSGLASKHAVTVFAGLDSKPVVTVFSSLASNNYKALNLITTALGRKVYDRVSHLEMAHDVWLKLCNTYEGSSEIKSSHMDTYNRQYQTFSQKPVNLLMIALLCLSLS
jgi:hypothetical protein